MILGMSVALVMAALTLIGATGPERHVVRRRLPVQLGLAAGAAMVGAGSGHLPPTALVVSLCALCAAQLLLTSPRNSKGGEPRDDLTNEIGAPIHPGHEIGGAALNGLFLF